MAIQLTTINACTSMCWPPMKMANQRNSTSFKSLFEFENMTAEKKKRSTSASYLGELIAIYHMSIDMKLMWNEAGAGWANGIIVTELFPQINKHCTQICMFCNCWHAAGAQFHFLSNKIWPLVSSSSSFAQNLIQREIKCLLVLCMPQCRLPFICTQ